MRSRGGGSNGQLRLMLSDFRKKLAGFKPGVFAGPLDAAVAGKDRDLAERFLDRDCHSLARLEFVCNGPETSKLSSFESYLSLFRRDNQHLLSHSLHHPPLSEGSFSATSIGAYKASNIKGISRENPPFLAPSAGTQPGRALCHPGAFIRQIRGRICDER